jgi:hypothetical protein
MTPNLYTQPFVYGIDYFDFSTDPLDEIVEQVEHILTKKFESTIESIISKMTDAKFAYDINNQTIKNHLIFTIDSPNIFQPENIECIVFYKECENNIEVIDISAYFG